MTAGLRSKHNEAAALVAEMTLEEKAGLCSGRDFWHLKPVARLGLPSVMVTDGPHGLRKQDAEADHAGLNASVPATCFPTASALACSWDRELLQEIGVALGEECVAERVAVLLGPGMNIKRHPLCGRNFEYFSEDPLLCGELAAALIDGVQSQGVGTSVKHFAANNQEHGRMTVNAIVDERTLREIYLRGFEIAVRNSQPWTVMCAYNRLNGTYCSEHAWLLDSVLRDEWGFAGLVVSDWGAANERARGVAAGLDLEMPASGGINDARVAAAVRSGELAEAVLDRAATRNASLALLGGELEGRPRDVDHDAHHGLARRAAAQSAVLLKNDGGLLPLGRDVSIAVIGAFAQRPRYQGAGSSQVRPTRLDCAWDAMEKIAEAGRLTFAAGYDPRRSEPDQALIDEAVDLARAAEVAVVFAGLPGIYESEGFDRAHMRLPDQHNRLIAAVCDANPSTVVVLSNGAPVEMPWVDRPAAVLEAYLGGQAGGSAAADLLFGLANPCGKLAETFPMRQADVPSDAWFPGSDRQVQYREGLYVGYRYFDTFDRGVLFPFGHGLSYTRFEYGEIAMDDLRYEQGGRLEVSVDVTNVGDRPGAETAQLYVAALTSGAYRPFHELKGFAKTRLEPGETRRVTFVLDDGAFAVYDPEAKAWIVEAGEFELRVGASSRDIRQTRIITVVSDQTLSPATEAVGGPNAGSPNAGSPNAGDPGSADAGLAVADAAFAAMLGRPVPDPEPVRPYHLNSSVNEIAESWLGRLVKARVVAGFQQRMGARSSDETVQKMFEEMANNMPLRALPLFSRGAISFAQLEILVALLNGRVLRALRLWLSG
ncbi:MAG TPA: glycoside hydrolase family 3 C-terminal domain-containing protein [Pseudomonadales bacterium]